MYNVAPPEYKENIAHHQNTCITTIVYTKGMHIKGVLHVMQDHARKCGFYHTSFAQINYHLKPFDPNICIRLISYEI